MSQRRFPGIHAVLYALFDAEEQLDRRAMRQQMRDTLSADLPTTDWKQGDPGRWLTHGSGR